MRLHKIKFIVILSLFLGVNSCSKEESIIDDVDIVDEEDTNDNSVISVTNSPLEIRGVKWRQSSEDEFLQPDGSLDWWLNVPSTGSKVDVLNQLVRNNVNSIVIRVDDASRFKSPSQTNYNNAMDEILDLIFKAKENKTKVDFYLWGRIWMERDGNSNHGSVTNGANKVKEWFTPILDKAKQLNVLENIKGVVLVETNTDKIEDVKAYAKETLNVFNANANWNNADGTPFFTSRTFMTSGSGFGLDYRNVGDDNGEFFTEIKEKCKNFAFLYKYMRGAHETLTFNDYYNVPINGKTRTWDDMETNSTSFTKQERTTFLNYFGVKELTDYIKNYKDQYPTVANVVFWGDKWDGISKIPPLSRQALHESLVVTGNNTGHFFNLASSETTNTVAIKFYLLNGLQPNQVNGWSQKTTYQEWYDWSSTNANY